LISLTGHTPSVGEVAAAVELKFSSVVHRVTVLILNN